MSSEIEKYVDEQISVPDPQPAGTEIKHMLESKTFWANMVALTAFAIQSKYGFVFDPAIQMEIVTFINIILRAITNRPVNW